MSSGGVFHAIASPEDGTAMPIYVGSRAIGLASGHVLHSEIKVLAGDGMHGVRSGMGKLVGP